MKERQPAMLEYNRKQNIFHFNYINDDWTFTPPLHSNGWYPLCMVDVEAIMNGGLIEREFFDTQDYIIESIGAYTDKEIAAYMEDKARTLGVLLQLPDEIPPRRHDPIKITLQASKYIS